MIHQITIPFEDRELYGHLTLPKTKTKAWVVFAHGSGSSRKSSRNNWVASKLNENGFATLLFDLLTSDEDEVFQNRFDIQLLGDRLLIATHWLIESSFYHHEPIAYFGASTGAAAALYAAANAPKTIPLYGIISRGGRPDLAGQEHLNKISLPTLLIVGSHDGDVIRLNELARKQLVDSKLVLIPGATHLFEEPGALDEVVEVARDWLMNHLKNYPLEDLVHPDT
jgi:pimeloyl-ACP methyl ester carboxylesterase